MSGDGGRGDRDLAPQRRRALAHGRSLEWISGDAAAGGDVLAIRDPDGNLEVTVALEAGGPVVRVRGARLEVATPEELAVDCRALQLRAREGLSLEAGGDFRVRSGAEIRMKSRRSAFIDADWVNLNCLDRTGYHDEHLEDAGAGADADADADTDAGTAGGRGDGREE